MAHLWMAYTSQEAHGSNTEVARIISLGTLSFSEIQTQMLLKDRISPVCSWVGPQDCAV